MRAALNRRTEHLVSEGLVRRQEQRVLFAQDLLDTLRQRELGAAGERIAALAGLLARPLLNASMSRVSTASAISCLGSFRDDRRWPPLQARPLDARS